MAVSVPLGVVGGGNMAQAIVRGGLEAGVLTPGRMVIAEPQPAKREFFRHLGISVVETGEQAVRWLAQHEHTPGDGQVLLAVKPQSLGEVGQSLAGPMHSRRRVVVSMLAGAATPRIQEALGGPPTAVVRVMPNLPVQIRRGTTALALGAGAKDGDEDAATALFSALGHVVKVEEPMMDAFTAVVGSGPAYLFFLAEAMTRAAMDIGFDRDTAQWIVRWTLTGAAALLDVTDQPPGTLRAAVTSRGGTTAAAMEVLEQADVMGEFVRAIRAARDRGQELGR